VSIPASVNGKLRVRNQAGTTVYEINNVPNSAPPTGELPVRKRVDGLNALIPWNYISKVSPQILTLLPTVTIVLPSAPLVVTAGTVVTLQATCTLGGSPASTDNIAWSSNLNGNLGTGGYLQVSSLIVGAHTITATFVNKELTATDTETVTVNNPAIPPVVTIVTPTGGNTFAFGASITFNATAVDAVDGNLSQNIVWSINTDASFSYVGQTFTVSNLPIGNHTVLASCFDNDLSPNEGNDFVNITIVAATPYQGNVPLAGAVVVSQQQQTRATAQ
jgi:hypothetical protein